MRKPPWLNKKIDFALLEQVKRIRKDLRLHTVCEEAKCPNISECFSKNTATFLLLGNLCTRNCAFCGIEKGKPLAPDANEPKRIAEAVRRLKLEFVVLTSVCRDDLNDKGAGHFIKTIQEIRKLDRRIGIETLIPDFGGKKDLIRSLVNMRPDVVSHNIETTPDLYPLVRSAAGYEQSLDVLRSVKEIDRATYTKSAILLGLGENEAQVMQAFRDLRQTGCNFLSIGQYLAPLPSRLPVKEYISPERFAAYRQKALDMGFDYVVSSAYTRSSYKARQYIAGH